MARATHAVCADESGSSERSESGQSARRLSHVTRASQRRKKLTILRSVGAVLAATMAVVAAFHSYQLREDTLIRAESDLALLSAVVAARLDDAARYQKIESSDAHALQTALSAVVAKGALQDGRAILLTGANGIVQTAVPSDSLYLGRPLTDVIGENQPLTILGARAGVLRIGLTDGEDGLVTVNTLSAVDGQVVVIEGLSSVLAPWRRQIWFMASGIGVLGFGFAFVGFTSLRRRPWEGKRSDMPPETASLGISQALGHAHCGVWDWDIARGATTWSASMFELLGLEPSDQPLPYCDIQQRIVEDLNLIALVNDLIGKGETSFDQTFSMRHADGRPVRMRLRGEIVRRGLAGEPHLTAVAIDLSGQDNWVWTGTDPRLREAIETIPEAFVLWDSSNRLLICNEKYKEFYNLPDDVLTPGTSYDTVIGAAEDPTVLSGSLIEDDPQSGARTYEVQLETGAWLQISERRTGHGGYVSVGTDITAVKESQRRLSDSEQRLKFTIADLQESRHELERQTQELVELAEKYMSEKTRAEKANRSKSEFLANISHELRTPLNAVIGFSEVMQRGLFGDLGSDKYVEYADDIHESGKYLLQVINDILDMSKIETGRMSLNLQPVDLDDIIAESLKIMSCYPEAEDLRIEHEGDKGLHLTADRRALKQTLLNLLSNAVKFTPAGGTVKIQTIDHGDRIELTIADTGIGIAPEHLRLLGRPFEQVANQFTKGHRGSGLGLAISRSLMQLHNGSLTIASVPGEGTEVSIAIPIAPAAPNQNAKAA